MGIGTTLASSYNANSMVYFILAASVIELIAAGSNCQSLAPYESCTDYNAWAVAVGAISVGFTLIFAIMTMFANSFAEKLAPFVSIFLVLLWIPGAFVNTFKAPFLYTGNGYYASWGAFFFSVGFFQQVGVALFAKKDAEPPGVGSSSTAV